MMTSNNALIPDPDKEDILASAPSDWPWLHLGLRMCGWGDTNVKYYLLGECLVFCSFLSGYYRGSSRWGWAPPSSRLHDDLTRPLRPLCGGLLPLSYPFFMPDELLTSINL
jgi:hypothetical protein